MKRSGADRRRFSISPYGQIYMWDGRASRLRSQALGPLQIGRGKAMPSMNCSHRSKAIDEYLNCSEAAFPGEGISAKNVAKASPRFERP